MANKFGLIIQAVGYFILSLSVLIGGLKKFISFQWEKKPLEIRLALRLIGIKNNNDYSAMFDGKDYPDPDNFTLIQRIIYDLPLIAVVLIVIGVILSLI